MQYSTERSVRGHDLSCIVDIVVTTISKVYMHDILRNGFYDNFHNWQWFEMHEIIEHLNKVWMCK